MEVCCLGQNASAVEELFPVVPECGTQSVIVQAIEDLVEPHSQANRLAFKATMVRGLSRPGHLEPHELSPPARPGGQ